MTGKQQTALRFIREWGPIVVLAIGAKVMWPSDRFAVLEQQNATIDARVTRVEEMRGDVEAMALSLCLVETNPIARQRLQCGRRESEAGIVRR